MDGLEGKVPMLSCIHVIETVYGYCEILQIDSITLYPLNLGLTFG